jgi:hypothetical protein
VVELTVGDQALAGVELDDRDAGDPRERPPG